MANYSYKFYLSLAVLFAAALAFLIFGQKVNIPLRQPAEAAVSDNVSGWAWSENIGWISFNNTTDGSPASYGVSIDGVGNFSGYAWSENIGWISFNRSDVGNPPSSDPGGGSGPIAKYNYGDGKVYGWARALANGGGWDGWIRFDHGAANPVSVNASTGDFSGWAWGSDVAGWISFNSANAGAGGGPYKVVADLNLNLSPSASSLQITAEDYCSYSPGGVINFQWQYSDPDGDSESQYQIQVDDNSDFSSPEVDITQSVSLPSPSNNARIVYAKESPGSNELSFGVPSYWWRVKVWDAGAADSGFVNGPSSFSTNSHPSPAIDFTWSPSNPSAAENIRFTDTSISYGGAAKTAWSWNFQDGAPASSNQQNPQTTFTTSGTKNVSLQVTDSDGFSCADSKSVPVQVQLPSWKEIKSTQ